MGLQLDTGICSDIADLLPGFTYFELSIFQTFSGNSVSIFAEETNNSTTRLQKEEISMHHAHSSDSKPIR